MQSITHKKGFTLAEIILVVGISSMVMAAAIGLYRRTRQTTSSIIEKVGQGVVDRETLQLIAEDLDRMATMGVDTLMTIENKPDASGGTYNKTRLVMENSFYDTDKKEQLFEKIVWQSDYDFNSGKMVLYRSRNGLYLDDKILADTDTIDAIEEGKEIFIPICEGVTFFKIDVPQVTEDGYDYLEKWDSKTLPTAIRVRISLADPVENINGIIEIEEDDIYTRTMAVDRTREITYVFIPNQPIMLDDDGDVVDPNDIESGKVDPNELSESETETPTKLVEPDRSIE